MDGFFLAAILFLGGLALYGLGESIGQGDITRACQRDGFFWSNGERYDCKRVTTAGVMPKQADK